MDGAQPGAGEHDHGEFRDHGHVYGHAVAFFDAHGLEDIGALADLLVEFGVGDLADLLFGFTLPEDGDLVFGGGVEVAVETVCRDIELAILEPGVLDVTVLGIPGELAGLGGFFDPLQSFCLFHPEGIGVFY